MRVLQSQSARHAALRLLGLALAALLLAACGRAPRQAPIAPGSVVLAFGDSVTHGTGAGAGEDYPTRLAAATGWEVVNAGIPGDTAQAARDRIAGTLEQVRPALVILELGGNDFLRRRPEAEVKEDLRALVAEIRRAGVPVVLVGVPRFSLIGALAGSLPESEIYAQLAKEEKLVLVDKVFARVLSDPNLKADQIHPNAAGYRALADGIVAKLADAGFIAGR